jgi:hypothetical protein
MWTIQLIYLSGAPPLMIYNLIPLIPLNASLCDAAREAVYYRYSSDIDRSNSIYHTPSLIQQPRWHTITTDTQIHTNNTQDKVKDRGNTHHTTNPTLPTLTPRTPNTTIRIAPTNNLNITLQQIRSMSMKKRMLHLWLRERGKGVRI